MLSFSGWGCVAITVDTQGEMDGETVIDVLKEDSDEELESLTGERAEILSLLRQHGAREETSLDDMNHNIALLVSQHAQRHAQS